MQKQKTPHDVRGFQMKCVNYIQCPICYGCRNYNDYDPECIKCRDESAKINLCNTRLHKSDLVNKMVIHSKINDFKDNQIQFKSFNR